MTPTSSMKKVVKSWSEIDKKLSQSKVIIDFDITSEVIPKSKISAAESMLKEALITVKKREITKLGKVAIQAEISASINTLAGVKIMIEESQSKTKINTLLKSIVSKIDTLQQEVAYQVGLEKDLIQAADIQIEAEVKEAAKAVQNKYGNINNKLSFNGLTSSEVQSKIENIIKSISLEYRDVKSVSSAKQEDMITGIQIAIDSAEKSLLREFVNAKKHLTSEYTIFQAKIPLMLQTQSYIDKQKLRASRIKHDIFTSPDMKVGSDPVNPGGGKSNPSSPTYVFYDQLVVGLLPSVDSTDKEIDNYLKEFRSKIIDIISARLGVKYSDVVGSVMSKSNLDEANFMSWRKTRSVRYVWLLESSKLAALGHFKITNTRLLPFVMPESNVNVDKLREKRMRKEAKEAKHLARKRPDESPSEEEGQD